MESFIVGVMRADPWYRGYRLPSNFESVINWISFCLQEEYGDEVVPKVSIIEIVDKFKKWAFEHPDFSKWNECEGVVVRVE